MSYGGSVAQIVGDSLFDSMVLVGVHEQTHPSDLPHDQLAFRQCRPEAARLAADLVIPPENKGLHE